MSNLLQGPGELLFQNFLQTFLLRQPALALLQTGGAQVIHTLQWNSSSGGNYRKYCGNLSQILLRMTFNPVAFQNIFYFLFLSLSLNSTQQREVISQSSKFHYLAQAASSSLR